MKIVKMIFKSVMRSSAIIFVISAILPWTTIVTVALELGQDHHRSSSKLRDNWPSWFHHREESSMSNDLLSGDRHELDENRHHARHESVSRSKSRAGARMLHDAILRNSRNRNNEANSAATMRIGEKKFYDTRGFENLANETPGHYVNVKSSSSHRDMRNDALNFFESRTLRPTTTTTTTTTMRTRQDSRVEDSKPEKLTAVAVAEYTGTRAVAYAGYHHHNLDYNPTRTREILTPGYAIVATAATPSYTKHHAGRRVCSRQAPTSIAHHHRSRQYRLVYTELSSSTFLCCPGWSQVSRTSYGCNRPTCALPCLNGGVCGPHGKCNCPKAFTGTQCQTDIDECVTEKPCGQLCTNLPGSYECHCRHGFHLQPDGQSCRKNGSDGTAFEARDLENDYGYTTSTTTETTRRTTPTSHDTENEVGEGNVDQDYEIILKRLAKLEKQIARGRKRDTEAQEMSAKITQAVEGVTAMRRAVDNVQLMQQEIYDMRGKLKQFELESRKLQHLTNRVADLETRLRIRCRNSING